MRTTASKATTKPRVKAEPVNLPERESKSAKAEKPPIKLPKSLPAAVDLYYQLREKRLEMDKAAAEVKKQESYVREHLIQTVPKSNMTGLAGKLCRVTVVTKEKFKVGDWQKFYAYLVKTKRFDLMQKRISDTAVAEMVDNGVKIPGVEKESYVDLSVNKV